MVTSHSPEKLIKAWDFWSYLKAKTFWSMQILCNLLPFFIKDTVENKTLQASVDLTSGQRLNEMQMYVVLLL